MSRCDTCRFLDAGYCSVLDVVVAHGQEVGKVCKVADMFDKYHEVMIDRLRTVAGRKVENVSEMV